jgi:hypothetical protein
MVPSLTTALDVAFYGRQSPTFVEPRGRRLAVASLAILLGAAVTLWAAFRFDLGDLATIGLSYATIFVLMHALGYLTHLLGLAGE